MANGSFSDYQVTAWLTALAGQALYASLHYYNPAQGGLGWAEITGGSYARQPLTLTVSSGRSAFNQNTQTFTGLSAVTVQWIGAFDAASGGDLIAQWPVIGGLAVPAGGSFTMNPGDLAIQF